jgi:hypothetical protein
MLPKQLCLAKAPQTPTCDLERLSNILGDAVSTGREEDVVSLGSMSITKTEEDVCGPPVMVVVKSQSVDDGASLSGNTSLEFVNERWSGWLRWNILLELGAADPPEEPALVGVGKIVKDPGESVRGGSVEPDGTKIVWETFRVPAGTKIVMGMLRVSVITILLPTPNRVTTSVSPGCKTSIFGARRLIWLSVGGTCLPLLSSLTFCCRGI